MGNKLDGNAKFGCSGCLKEEPAFLGLFVFELPTAYRIKTDLPEVKSRGM